MDPYFTPFNPVVLLFCFKKNTDGLTLVNTKKSLVSYTR